MKLFFALTAIAALFFISVNSSTASAAKVVCYNAAYTNPPELGSDKIFRIPIYSDCLISETSHNGIESLRDFLSEKTEHSDHLNSGPLREIYLGMPSLLYDVTEDSANPHGNLAIRSEVHVASQGARLIYESDSKSIHGSGESSYLRQFDISLSVQKNENGEFTVRYLHRVYIAKPWYAPAGTFKNEAEKGVKNDFISARDGFLKEISEKL